MQRRRFLGSLGAVITVKPFGTLSRQRNACRCKVADSEDTATLTCDPDFQVKSSEKTHDVFWRPKSHFVNDKGYDENTVAYAKIGGSTIVLNEAWSPTINTSVIAHEVGHNLDHEHTDGTLMDPSITSDAESPGESLADVTRSVFTAVDFAELIDWQSNDSRQRLLDLVESYISSDSDVTRQTLNIATENYISSANNDSVLYSHDWSNFAGDDQGVSYSGEFYRHT